MINSLYNNNNDDDDDDDDDDKKLTHNLRISIIVKQASIYKNRFKTALRDFRKNKIMCPVPQMPGPPWGSKSYTVVSMEIVLCHNLESLLCNRSIILYCYNL